MTSSSTYSIPFTGIVVNAPGICGVIGTNLDELASCFPNCGLWEPSVEQVLEAEVAVRNYAKALADEHGKASCSRRQKGCGCIYRNLGKYFRQYLGITHEGRKKIFCNFHWHESEQIPDTYCGTKGGGCRFFRTWYDLESKEIDWLGINAPR